MSIQKASSSLATPELNNLGLVQQGLGRLDEAEATFREVLDLQYRIVGRDRPYPGYHEMNLARVLQDFGRYHEAEVHYQRALALWQRLLPQDHTLVGNVNIWFGALLAETGRAERALEISRRGSRSERPIAARSIGRLPRPVPGSERHSQSWGTSPGPRLCWSRRVLRSSSREDRRWGRTRWALRRILGFYDLVEDRAEFERWDPCVGSARVEPWLFDPLCFVFP